MRLRLQIRRHRLPTSQVLWSVPDCDIEHTTLLQLLQNVNEIFPLEAEHWGLEHYVVSVGGYECLHFQTVAGICKDEDEVVIRPLQKSEIRGRTRAGRTQVNAGGQHLVDGIAFGRTYFRTPDRPSVRIPAMTPDLDEYVGIETSQDGETLLLEGGSGYINDGDLEEEEDESDEDFEPQEDSNADDSSDDAQEDNQPQETPQSPLQVPRKSSLKQEHAFKKSKKNHVSFTSGSGGSDDDQDTEDDASFVASDASSSSGRSSDSSSEDSESDSDTTSDSGSDSSSDSDSDSDSEASDSGPEEVSSQAAPLASVAKTNQQPKAKAVWPTEAPFEGFNDSPTKSVPGVPFTGKRTTQARNARRRATKQVQQLIAQGVLKRGSTRKDLDEYLSTVVIDSSRTAPATQDRPTVVNSIQLQEGSLTQDISAPIDNNALEEASHPPTKRIRVDREGSQRAIFGSLGVKAPKSAEDAERVRQKLAGSKHAGVVQTTETPQKLITGGEAQEIESAEDPDLWRSKITLKAVECLDTNAPALTAPDYPFQKYQNLGYVSTYQQQGNGGGSRKRKRKQRPVVEEEYYEENQEYYEDHGDYSYLDYGEADGSSGLPYLNTETNGVDIEDDMPPLPEDVASLPVLAPDDVRRGAIVVFKRLEMDANYNPVISPARTAKVESVEGSSIILELAKRDQVCKPLKHDKNGKRIYDKFQMPEYEETHNPAEVELDFSDFSEAWLLQAAPDDAAPDAVTTEPSLT